MRFTPQLIEQVRADQVASLYRSWHRTTARMLLGATLLCTVLWEQVNLWVVGAWLVAILANQAWRGLLTRAFARAQPRIADAPRWGAYWTVGATLAGALWGSTSIVLFPTLPSYQALFIVCQFGVILGGLNLTVVYKPSFYGFVLAALLPLIVRVASIGDQVHLFTALVLGVVLAFVLAFGRQVNDLLTESLAMRYENLDLIGELKAQTEAALAARANAETANRAKSQFLAAASHDLRQPLHAMGLFAAALSAKARDPETKPLVASIRSSMDALERLFAQLLDLSRLEAGALQPTPMPFALEPMFAHLRDDFAGQASASGIRLRTISTSLAVRSDPVLLERILRNFLSNALRNTRSGGIVMGARRRSGAVRIDVVDSGVGIADTDRAHIFDEFVQLATPPRNHSGGRGMGLGLAIVRRLGELLGHPIELASTPGRGSRFSITVPRTSVFRRDRQGIPAPNISSSAGSAALAGRRIIVVDDDPTVVDAMRALFVSWNAIAEGGADAASALCALRDNGSAGVLEADLIVADLRLGDGQSGIDTITKLRSVLGVGTPALIVSGDTSAEAQAEVDAAGIQLLTKPVIASALKDAAEAALFGRAAA